MIRGLRLLGVLGLCALTLALTGTASAGTVFLKNGYVIQGDIVDRVDDGVVMQWPDGRVTIYDRFVSDVIIDPQELAAMERRERILADQAPVTRAVRPVMRQAVLRLPASLDEIMSPETASASTEVATTQPPTNTDVPVVEVLDPIGAPGANSSAPPIEIAVDAPIAVPTEHTQIAEIPNPAKTPIEEIVPARTAELEFPELGFAIVPPSGWLVLEDGDSVRLRPSSDDPFPSLNITVQLNAIDQVEDAGQVLEDVLRAKFPGVEVHAVRQQQVGFERAFVIDGQLSSKNLQFTQVLIPHAGGHYLVGLQAKNTSDDADQRLLRRSLHSLRFLTD